MYVCMFIYIYIYYIYIYVYIYMCIYIYMYREREKESESNCAPVHGGSFFLLTHKKCTVKSRCKITGAFARASQVSSIVIFVLKWQSFKLF